MDPSMSAAVPSVAFMGLVAGLVLLVRGLNGYRTTVGVADTSTSPIISVAVGQVPGALLAPLFGWRPREFFRADPADIVRPDTDLRPA